MGILTFLGLKGSDGSADELYKVIVQQARQPVFYLDCGVPDSIGGRFEMVALHAYIAMRRLKNIDDEGAQAAQSLFDTLLTDMDRYMREMGIGDLGVGRRIKALAISFYGRVKAYDEALLGEEGELVEALERNLLLDGSPYEEQVLHMAGDLSRNIAAAENWSLAEMMAGNLTFGKIETLDHG